MPGKKGMRKAIRWDDSTRETIMAAWQKLRDEGWKRISIRKVLYELLELPGWTKKHYDTLCAKLGEWRDGGLIEFGLFAVSGGADHVPMTPREIQEALEALRDATPASLGPDGWLHVVLVEHAEDVEDIADMLDGACVVSSGGQLRREHLHLVFRQLQAIVRELRGKGIRAIMLVDYDKGGDDIFEAHRAWLRKIFRVDLVKWGITPDQIRGAGLPSIEGHEIEGGSGRFGHDRLRRELRQAIGLSF